MAMLAGSASAQETPPQPVVLRVEILGLEPGDIPAAQAQISTRSGSLFDERTARADQRRLMATGLYEDAAVITSASD